MKDLYNAINALNEISQAERDEMRAQAQADRNVGLKALGRLPKTKAELDQEVRDFAKQQRAASKAAGYATKAEYDAAYQQNLDNLAKAGVNMDDVYAAANKMTSTEKGAARLAKMGIRDNDDLIAYAMSKAGIKDVTPDKYTATDFAITDIPEDELTFENEEALDERVTYSTLAKLSGIKDPNKIYPGQKISLPGGGSYTVKSGDTLSGIAQDFRLKKIGQPKSGKLDDPTPKLPQITKPEPGTEPGDFEIPSQYAGDDTDDRLNKYDMDQAGNYKLDPKSVVQPDKKKSDSLFKTITDYMKNRQFYNIATTNPAVKTLPATVQDKSNTSKQSVMDLAKKIEADPKFQAQSSDEKAADIAQMAANNAAQRAEIYKRLNNKQEKSNGYCITKSKTR